MEEILYNRQFYEMLRLDVERSVKPILNALKKSYHGKIRSAVDLGCGMGAWLRGVREIFDENAELHGYDGDYVKNDILVISKEEFTSWDLRKKVVEGKKYDIAISLEVAEHLPEYCADVFVDSLIGLSDLILFSAAIPNQGGVGHINEQPLHYWIKKFNKKGYMFYDVIRPKVWNNTDVSFWYKQNVVVFVKSDSKSATLIVDAHERIVDLAHPELLQIKETDRIMRSKITLWDCYEHISIIRDLFDSFSGQEVVIRTGGNHTRILLSLIGAENKKKIIAIIDGNPNCRCKEEGYPIIQFTDINHLPNIKTVILSSFKMRNELAKERQLYPKEIKVIDLYQYLESYGFVCNKEFFLPN